MASPNQTNLPQQQTDYEHLTPPPSPTTATFPNTEVAGDQAQQQIDIASSASSPPATGASPSEPSTLEQKTQDGNTTQPPNPEPSSSATAANPYDRPVDLEDQESGPSDTTSDGSYNPSLYEECDTWHDCDRCGNIIRCSFETFQTRNVDKVHDGAEVRNKASEEQPTARGLLLYLARLIALHFPLFARLFPCIGVNAAGGNKNGQPHYHATIVPAAQGWNIARYATPPPTGAGGEIEAASAVVEEKPLSLRVKYQSRPIPDPSEAENTRERGASYTTVSDILPSDSYPAVMAKILHQLKGTDGTHSPYPMTTTAHAPGFLGRKRIEDDNVGDLLNYLRQHRGGDDILDIFLVPVNEQDAQQHVPNTYEDWRIEEAMEGKGVNVAELG